MNVKLDESQFGRPLGFGPGHAFYAVDKQTSARSLITVQDGDEPTLIAVTQAQLTAWRRLKIEAEEVYVSGSPGGTRWVVMKVNE